MTKPITVTAVMMLFEEGHFLLDDPISDFLSEFAAGGGILRADPPDRDRSKPRFFSAAAAAAAPVAWFRPRLITPVSARSCSTAVYWATRSCWGAKRSS
jgi:hypothetical protein